MESCSLFSPMNEFRDMPHALEVARDAAQALFTPAPVSVVASTRTWKLRPPSVSVQASPASGTPYRSTVARVATVDTVRAFLSRHRDDDGEGFCRHGEDDLSTTIAGAIWDTATRRLFMAAGNPCRADWRRYDVEPGATRAAAD
jgi:hypothetical protein